MANKPDIQKRVEDLSYRIFTINGCPETVFQEFLSFCRAHAKNIKSFKNPDGTYDTKEELIYHFGLKLLLDAQKSNPQIQVIYQRMLDLEKKFDELRKKVEDEKKPAYKTMGSKLKETEVELE